MARIIAPHPRRFLARSQQYRSSITMVDIVRDALLAFARLHVLHHAAEGPIFGLGMMKELRRHGYVIGPGTLYPLLHRLEADGLLVSRTEVVGGKTRTYYESTAKGRKALRSIGPKIAELADELLSSPHAGATQPPRKRKRSG